LIEGYFDLTGLTYSTAVNIGTQNSHFYRTQTAFDKKGQVNKTVSAAGTITRTENDALGRAVSTWVGTDDTPTTGVWSPVNLAGTNLVKVAEVEYDGGGVGDSNATKMTMFPGGGAANRVSQAWYDWRDRAIAGKAGVEASESTATNRPIQFTQYDNLGQSISSEVYDGDAVTIVDAGNDGVPDRPAASLMRAKTVASYDELGRAYKTETYGVDPSNGTVSTSALTSQVWFDIRGLTLKSSSPGGLVQKTAYDSLGRATTMYVSDGSNDLAWADAGNVTDDTVLSQSEMTYDADSNVILSTSRERFHDATGAGALGTAITGVLARVSYSTAYYDKLNRMTDSVDVGTNGGVAYTRGALPARSDTALVSSVVYDAAGRQWKTVDPRGLENRTSYDLLGRTVKTVQNYVDGTVSDLDDKTTEYTYSAAGMTKLTARLTGAGMPVQTTEWVYGVGSSGNLYSNDIVGVTKWPDATTGLSSASEQEVVTVNALGQILTSQDRNGNVHTIGYDVLGRVVSDAVTTLGAGVDGAVRRTETAYDSQGNAYLLSSYSAAVGGTMVNQVQRTFNGLGQLTIEYQSHSGAVNTATTPKVQYAYSALDTSNRSRLTSMTYPNGRVVGYNYAAGLDSTISRLSSITDSGVTLESYSYLGLGTVVVRSHPQNSVDLSYVKLTGEAVGDAGDQYTGLDRFGRIVDQRWRAGSVDKDRNKYTYDRDSNRLTKVNSVNSAFNEVYTYDGLNQVASFNRGSGARTQSFDYDALGNRDGVTTNGSTQTYTANRQNEITSISGATTPTYDANGNMTGDETGKLFVYDAWNRLVAVKNSGGTVLKTYGYDSLKHRVTETVSGTTTDLYYSAGWQVLEERVAGVTRVSNVWSPAYVDAMIARDRDTDANGTLDERLYVTHDANFNVTGLVNTSGAVVERYVYDTYGAATVLNGNWTVLGGSVYAWQYLHQGGRVDGVSGLVHFRNRDYSVTLGRWATMDPIRYTAGDVDLYRALANNPIKHIDPTGELLPLIIVVIVVGGAFVGGSGYANAPTTPSEQYVGLVEAETVAEGTAVGGVYGLAIGLTIELIPIVGGIAGKRIVTGSGGKVAPKNAPTPPPKPPTPIGENELIKLQMRELQEAIKQGHKDKLDPKHLEEMSIQLAKLLREARGKGLAPPPGP
jgi:RHS repeat-associated protein